jgi:glycosyltransferase involved in cell wall biosynthesis
MTGTQPAVSVIVPCYNVTEYIPEALDSLRAQTFRNFEAILINDGCPDTANLERALEPYRSEIVYIKQENAGPAGARNRGIKAARSPLIALLDADDVWEPNYLEVQTGILRAHPEVDVLYPNAVYFGAGAGSWSGRKFMDMFPSAGDPTFQRILSGQCAVFVGVTARREALLRVGLLDFDPELSSVEDLDLWLRLAKAGAKFSYHHQPLARYRIRAGSLSDDKVALARAAIRVYHKLLGANHVTEEERRGLQRAIRIQDAMIEFGLGRKALYACHRDEALRRLTLANKVLNKNELRAAILILRVWPELLYKFIHNRYPTEHAFLH